MDFGNRESESRPGKNNVSPHLTEADLRRSLHDEDFARLKAEALKAQIPQEELWRFEFAQDVCELADMSNVYVAADAMGIEPSAEIDTIMKACVMAGAARMMSVLGPGCSESYMQLVVEELKRESEDL